MNPNLYPQSQSLSLSLITPSFPSPFSLLPYLLFPIYKLYSYPQSRILNIPFSILISLSAFSVLSVVEYDKIETRTRIRMRIATRKRMMLGYWRKLFFPLVLIVLLHLLLLVVVI